MEKYFEKITENLYAFVLWDESWNSYNNCYVLVEGNNATLIDSGKEEHFKHLESAMRGKGINVKDVSTFVATHGHKDHIGGVNFIEGLEGYIHHKDLELLPDEIRTKLNRDLPNNDMTVRDLECIHLGHHTKGSVALYDKRSKALFCGDHICFFGVPLNNNNIVDHDNSIREKYKKFISDWSESEENRNKHNFDLFIKGLKAMNEFDVEYLCTGHGVILKGSINKFLSELIEYENQ